MSSFKKDDILISQIKKYFDKNNPYKKEKELLYKNKSNPSSIKKEKKIKNVSNSLRNLVNVTDINLNNNCFNLTKKDKENNKLKIKISQLEKEFKKQKIELNNQIISLREENKNFQMKAQNFFKNYEIPIIDNSNKEKNNIILNLNEEIKRLKKKINILSDENIDLLNDKKGLKNQNMNLQKDKQFLIEQITELNKALNNKIKPKLNENEVNLMSLKNQIIELKNKNNELIKENITQKEIIYNLKEEIINLQKEKENDLFYKEESIKKEENINGIKNSKLFFFKQNMKNKSIFNDIDLYSEYDINFNNNNNLENDIILMEESTRYTDNIYRNKDSKSFINQNINNRLYLNNKNGEQNYNINKYKKRKHNILKFKNETTINNKKKYKNNELNINNKENKENHNYNGLYKNLNNIRNKKEECKYSYNMSCEKINNINMYMNYQYKQNNFQKKNCLKKNLSSNKSLLSDYIDEIE